VSLPRLARSARSGALVVIASLAGALSLAGTPARSVPAPEVLKALDVALGSGAESRGDRALACDEMLAALEGLGALAGRRERLAAAEVLLARMEELSEDGGPPQRSAAVLERLLRARDEGGRAGPPGRLRGMLVDALARLYRAAGEFGRAEALERELGFVRNWVVCGPFGHTTKSVHVQEFAPERELDLSREERSLWRKLAWRPLEAPGAGRRVDLFAPLAPREGCAYALAQARWSLGGQGPSARRTSGAPQRPAQGDSTADDPGGSQAVLVFRCEGSHKLWWNGELVIDADLGRERLPCERAIAVRLRKGWNRLLVKVTAADPVISCRLVDMSGYPLEGIEWEKAPTLHELDLAETPASKAATPPPTATQDAAQAAPDGRVPTVDWGGARALAALLERGGVRPEEEALVRAALGLVARLERREEEELSYMEAASRLAPDRPHIAFQLARTVMRSSLLPPSVRRSRALECWTRAASAEGGFVPADEEIALRLWRDKKPDQAISRLREALARSGGPLLQAVSERPVPRPPRRGRVSAGEGRIWLLMAEIALSEGWTNEAVRFAQDAEKADPAGRAVHLFWGRFHASLRNYTFAIGAYRQALKLDESDTASREALARLLFAQGDSTAAIHELRRALEADPSQEGLYRELARMECEAGRYEDAAATCQAALRTWRSSAEFWRLLGEIHLRQLRTEKAAEAWETALQIRPGWLELRRELQALRGEDEDFSKPFAIDVKKAIAESRTAAEYPNSDSILVVDQTVDRLYEDGSYSEITHQAQKVLTTEGAEELSHIDVEGELLEARTHRPDGTVLEPAVLPGRDKLTMPGVEIGSVVEYKYRRDHPAPPGGFVTLPSWYFRSLKVPHQVSDYVVIAPKGMALSISVRNWGRRFPEESFEELPVREEGDLVVHRWIARNTRPVEPGTGHDHMSTLLPHVDIGRARSWQDLNAELSDLFLGRTRLTESLRAEAARAVEGLTGWEAKVRAIFRHVNSLVRSDAELYEANHVLLARAGSRSVLLAALLRAAGFDARFAVARPRPEAVDPSEGPGEPNWALPRPEYFRDTLVCVLGEGGEKLWLDPEGPYSAFGCIAPRFQGGTAFIVSPEGGVLSTLPWGALREHGESTETRLEVDPTTGSARGECVVTSAGAAGAALKQRFAESSASWRRTWAGRRLSEAVPGSRLTDLELRGLDDPDSPFVLRIAFTVDEALAGTLEWRELPTALDPIGMVRRFIHQPTREYPQKIPSSLVRWDEVTIRLPGARQWALPESRSERTAFGSYSLTFAARGEELRIARSVTIMSQVIEAERYEDFVRFARAIDSAEAAPLRVRLAPRR